MILPSLFQFLEARKATPLQCGHIAPDQLPQKYSYPAIMLEPNGDQDQMLLDGTISSLHTALVSVHCYDPSLLSAIALADRVKAALVGYNGPFGTVEAKWIYKEDETSAPELDTGVRGVTLVFFIAYS